VRYEEALVQAGAEYDEWCLYHAAEEVQMLREKVELLEQELRRSILAILHLRGLEPPSALHARLEGCDDVDVLSRWSRRAVTEPLSRVFLDDGAEPERSGDRSSGRPLRRATGTVPLLPGIDQERIQDDGFPARDPVHRHRLAPHLGVHGPGDHAQGDLARDLRAIRAPGRVSRTPRYEEESKRRRRSRASGESPARISSAGSPLSRSWAS
jgi:hypothetical protein